MLFADEPTGSVDTDTGRDIMEFVVHTSRAGGRDAHHRKHNPEVAALADASCA
jgi:ABC-type lipoprotein export system ATPase subunit